jgi:MtrB/PioB family decaheme-associated outer membrane protein
MKTSKEHFASSKLTLAVQWALVAMLAMPLMAVAEDAANAEAEAEALKRPTNFVEIGAMNVGQDSAKFGEYNGLDKSRLYGIANFDVRGGNAYDGGDGTTRWQIKGVDLGTTSRSVGGWVSNQGLWDLNISYDELRHNITDTFQTPFQGSMGGNNFALPLTFGIIDAAHRDAAGTGTQGMTADQLASFHTKDVHTDRKNTSFNAGYNFDLRWSVQFDYNHLEQSGAKLIGVAVSPDAAGFGAGENIATLMNPTNYKTDTYNLALNWLGDNGHLTASYFASIFKDENKSVSWMNPFEDNGGGTTGNPPAGGVFPINTFATAPSNNFYQLNLTGGYDFTPTTKLAGGLSYGRNTQDSNFINDPLLTSALPRSSLDGLVVTTHADLKLTNQTTKDLVLSAGLKYNERDNQTPSSTYSSFNSVAGDAFGAVVNTPLSNRKTQLELAGDYRIDKKQSVHLAYEYEAIKRWCNNSLANNFQSAAVLGDPATASYYTNTGCVESPDSKENKLSAGYRLKASEDVSLNAGYTYARRHADYNSSFYNPMQTSEEGLQNFGFRAYFDDSRTEQLVKAGIHWQANDKLDLGLNGRYVHDDYDATLGVQNGHAWGVNLDAAYSYSQDSTVSAYVSWQQRERDLLSGADHSPLAAPTSLWSNQLTDDTTTVGISAKQQGLMGGKLSLAEDLSYSYDKTSYSTHVHYADVLCSTYGITCGDLPDIKNKLLRLNITGNYQVNKSGKVTLGYTYQKLNSNDYYYSAYRTGWTDVTVLPTNQREPSYSVNVLTVAYTYDF